MKEGHGLSLVDAEVHHLLSLGMDNGLLIRTKNHETSNWLAFWAVQSAAQTKSIYVEKNAAQWLQIAKTRQN